jgi:carboxypeptidase Q
VRCCGLKSARRFFCRQLLKTCYNLPTGYMRSRLVRFRSDAFACWLAGISLVLFIGAESLAGPGDTEDAAARIREEGLNHSQVMETLSYLTEVIGPRLTASPNHKRANEWTRDKMQSWGLTNAHLEAWGPFGRGWSLKRFSAQVIEPQAIPVIAYPNAWSPGLDKPLMAEVVYLDASTGADLEKYKGKLRGAIVLNGRVRELKPRFEPLASRLMETNLLRLANASLPRSSGRRIDSASSRSREGSDARAGVRRPSRENEQTSQGTNATQTGSGPSNRGAPFGGGRSGGRSLAFLANEGAALVVNPSPMGDGGTVFVSAASLPVPDSASTNRSSLTNTPRPWSTNAPSTLPQITLAAEDYNRLVRMVQQGEKVKMAVDFQAEFQDSDLMAYNTIAEIPGTDLKDEIVMLGGHLDSWHAGTGATDDAIGVAVAMEASRILKQLDLHPRRTIRVGLWAGEEQGLLGSRAYVTRHFGYWTNAPDQKALRAPKDETGDKPAAKPSSTNSPPSRKLVRLAEYQKLSAYFNLDNGGGKIRGIYLQGNEAVRPIFRGWLETLRDLEAETISLSNTGGTDHIPFDAIGLPAFQFIQDPLDYFNRTHHSNEDVLDRIQVEDARQAATILALFVYNTAMLDERLPRKPAE